MTDYDLRDSEKFKIMIKVYEDVFVSSEHFSKIIGAGRSTVFNWIKKEKSSFNTKSKIKICEGFKLLDSVWSDNFAREVDFEVNLSKYQKIELQKKINEEAILEGLKHNKDESMKVESLSKDEVEILLKHRLEKESASFMFEFAEKLKSNKQIEEALEVLAWIEERENTFKYTHENRIRHLRAVLLSHEKIQDWDGAIHILRSLYHSRSYHLENPEVLTLLASNYKRKALDKKESKEDIDMTFITSALCLYKDAYNLKPDNEKYYDAINIAYLYNIVDAIEADYVEDKKEIKTIYAELSKLWRIDSTSWWEVISDAEFLMLLGNLDLAILKVNNFLDNHKVKPFEIDATFRQLKLYIHFSEDKNAKAFLEYLVESWHNL